MSAGEAVTPPAGLRDRMLAAALRARPAGTAVPVVPPITPAEAFGRAADAFYALLCALAEPDWHRPVLRDLDVQGLVGHLTGVEEDVQRALSGDPDVAEADHVASTQPAAEREAGRSPAATRAGWRAAADRTLALAPHAPPVTVAVYGLWLPLPALLVVRTFELWTHENDIRQVAGLPPSVPDPAALSLMTQLAATSLPLAAQRTGLPGPTDLRLVLTGPGGGSWDVAIGGDAAPAAITIVADAAGFCRLVANRAVPADLDLHTTGDPGRVAGLLAAASVLALD
ncbi:MAG TPA: maleylpyruvate isomerase family mycothiol-dependent enzyme [Streptosporangiaceae bacterium]